MTKNVSSNGAGSVQPTAATGVVGLGSKGINVKALQDKLTSLGFDAGESDGKFGEKTSDAVKAFQTANGLKADGKVGKDTRAAIDAAVAKKAAPAAPKAADKAKVGAAAAAAAAVGVKAKADAIANYPPAPSRLDQQEASVGSAMRQLGKNLAVTAITTNPIFMPAAGAIVAAAVKRYETDPKQPSWDECMGDAQKAILDLPNAYARGGAQALKAIQNGWNSVVDGTVSIAKSGANWVGEKWDSAMHTGHHLWHDNTQWVRDTGKYLEGVGGN